MSMKPGVRYLIAAVCVAISACSEKTVVRDVSGEQSASSPSASTIDATAGSQTQTPVAPDPIANPLVPSESQLIANMVDGQPLGSNTNAVNADPIDNSAPSATTDAGLQSDPGNSADNANVTIPAIVDPTTTNNVMSPAVDKVPAVDIAPQPDTDVTTVPETPVSAPAAPVAVNPLAPDPTVQTDSTYTPLPVITDVEETDIQADPVAVQADEEIAGAPGMSVDCQLILPCKWTSGDSQLAVTITNADNIGRQGRLLIEYAVSTVHDTQVAVANTEPAQGGSGLQYKPTALKLGAGIGGQAQGVMAGSAVEGNIEFGISNPSGSLAKWSIGLSDAGLVRQPEFTNIPVGSATTMMADCANILPCVWASPAGDVTITLLVATGAGASNRLSTNFRIDSTRDTIVAMDAGAAATGIDGINYKGRTHALGFETSPDKITTRAVAGGRVAGTVNFFTTKTVSASLLNLSLIVYEDRPVPRWNPRFLSIPVQ